MLVGGVNKGEKKFLGILCLGKNRHENSILGRIWGMKFAKSEPGCEGDGGRFGFFAIMWIKFLRQTKKWIAFHGLFLNFS